MIVLYRQDTLYLGCDDKIAFFTSDDHKRFELWSFEKVCDALIYLLDDIFIRFGTKLHEQSVEIPMSTTCNPLTADLFLFCYERDLMISPSDDTQAEVIEALNLTFDIWTTF